MITKKGIAKLIRLHEKGWSMGCLAKHMKLTVKDARMILSYGIFIDDSHKKYLEYKAQKTKSDKELLKKLSRFYAMKRKAERPYYILETRLYMFVRKTKSPPISIEQVFKKFGMEPKCYLTGEPIDYKNAKTYHLEHKIPMYSGGLSTIDNLELAIPMANQMKSNLSMDEFIAMCKKIAKRFE